MPIATGCLCCSVQFFQEWAVSYRLIRKGEPSKCPWNKFFVFCKKSVVDSVLKLAERLVRAGKFLLSSCCELLFDCRCRVAGLLIDYYFPMPERSLDWLNCMLKTIRLFLSFVRRNVGKLLQWTWRNPGG